MEKRDVAAKLTELINNHLIQLANTQSTAAQLHEAFLLVRSPLEEPFGFLNEREQKALTEMCQQKEMSEEALMRHALRVYQVVDKYLSEGCELLFFRRHKGPGGMVGEFVRPFDTGPKKAPYFPEPKGQDENTSQADPKNDGKVSEK
jgi:hypothetical protein